MILCSDIRETTVLDLTYLADCAALDRRFVCDDQALASRNHSNAADNTSADEFALDSDSGERRNLEKIRPVIQQQFHTLAGQEFPASKMSLDVMFAPAGG